MDALGWIIGAAVVLIAAAFVLSAPRLHSAHLRRQERGMSGGFAAVGAGFDSVWRPSAEEARTEWEASVEAPAPAPLAGGKGRIQNGRIVIAPKDHPAD
ncbi:hypothetical protein LK09_10890 [Microbacterium mangrovi]|uniref:Uncharacterized protein n=1 Tax=Microbacterium mangrovi TaxID=1348253 RepID=A0A0B2A6Z6_9MICO|nr:hypothetical protein [Microbacterium mangrovi]KHK97312.1 hypothetical protein LK09_10890 [Microbacterium mangrovi]